MTDASSTSAASQPSRGPIRTEPITVGILETHETCVSQQTRNSVVAELFEKNPSLPGILVTRESNGVSHTELTGVIPRAPLLERLSHKFWPELFLPRTVESLTEILRLDPLIVNEDFPVEEASFLAMQRPTDQVFETDCAATSIRSILAAGHPHADGGPGPGPARRESADPETETGRRVSQRSQESISREHEP